MTDSTSVNGPGSGVNGEGPARGHVGELRLRRLLAEELGGPERAAAEAHVGACSDCARRLEGVRVEQRAFEERISFDRFAAGVERAARVPAIEKKARWWSRPTNTWSFVSVFSLGAVASVAALVVTSRPLFQEARLRTAANVARSANRLKGGSAALTIRVAPPGDGPQRTAAVATPERLGAGERLRIGVRAGGWRYLFAVSIDDTGFVTPLYPETGTSVALPPGDGVQYLPDSVEMTGHGLERIVVLLTDEPTEPDIIRRAVADALVKAKGDVSHLPDLTLRGEQFHRTFLKP